jgi:Glucose / Sorbosone dehydrogenase
MKILLRAVSFLLLLIAFRQAEAQKLAVIPYVIGINLPIDLKHCGDDRLFVADRAGRIRIVNADGTLRPVPFLDITSKISSLNSEEGFLGIAFSPNYKTDGKFYVDYTAILSGQLSTVVEQYNASAADSNIADAASALTILTQLQPFSNHNGGNLMFGKDGFLYINFGDGGAGGDPYGNGQNKNTFLAKILRIDVSHSSNAQPYAIPPSNPFFTDTTTGLKKEIWTYGVRNPFRSSVDRLTGDLWIADVGQDAHEEIDYQPVNDPGGRNYGWNIMEGNFCYIPPSGCNQTGLSLPLYDYPHGVGYSIIGGYVWRNVQSKSLFGMYIFGDYVSKWVDGLRQNDGALEGNVLQLITTGNSAGNPVSFGEDRYGDQYILFNGDATVYKLEDTSSQRHPKAYLTPVSLGAGRFTLQALQGRNVTYQWLKNNIAIPGATSPEYTTAELGSYTLEVTNSLQSKDTSDVYLLGTSVNFLSLAANDLITGIIRLSWKTGFEQNITGYTVQRRKEGETSFSNIGFVAGKSVNGVSTSELDYFFDDSAALNYSRLFYRLEILHSDGSFAYSDIVLITSDPSKNAFVLFPNPASGHTLIYLNHFSLGVIVSVYDASGKKVFRQDLAGVVTTIPLPGTRGLYIIQVSDKDGGNKTRQKLIVN